MGGFCSCFHVPEEDQDDGSDASNDQHGSCLNYLKAFKNKCGLLFANAGSQTTNSPAAQRSPVATSTNAPRQVTVGNYNGVRICSSAINSDVQLSVAVSNNGVRIRSSQGPAERMNVRVNLPSKSSKDNSGRNSKGKKAEARHSASSVKVSSGKVETAAPKYVFPVEEDVCPTCLDEFTAENPKIISRCNHQFHLACIYEWMERSPTCPVCMRMMIFDE